VEEEEGEEEEGGGGEEEENTCTVRNMCPKLSVRTNCNRKKKCSSTTKRWTDKRR
jgi:hypothetical protein